VFAGANGVCLMEGLIFHAVAVGDVGHILELLSEPCGARDEPQAVAGARHKGQRGWRAPCKVDLGHAYGTNRTTLLHLASAKGSARAVEALLAELETYNPTVRRLL
jgi:hypothetical protein